MRESLTFRNRWLRNTIIFLFEILILSSSSSSSPSSATPPPDHYLSQSIEPPFSLLSFSSFRALSFPTPTPDSFVSFHAHLHQHHYALRTPGFSQLTPDACRLRWAELDAEKWSQVAPNTTYVRMYIRTYIYLCIHIYTLTYFIHVAHTSFHRLYLIEFFLSPLFISSLFSPVTQFEPLCFHSLTPTPTPTPLRCS